MRKILGFVVGSVLTLVTASGCLEGPLVAVNVAEMNVTMSALPAEAMTALTGTAPSEPVRRSRR